jgi:hypothetical protein
MEPSLSWETNSYSSSQEIPCHLWNSLPLKRGYMYVGFELEISTFIIWIINADTTTDWYIIIIHKASL